VTRHRHDKGNGTDRWDWSTVVMIVLAVAMVIFLTMALWTPHPFHH